MIWYIFIVLISINAAIAQEDNDDGTSKKG